MTAGGQRDIRSDAESVKYLGGIGCSTGTIIVGNLSGMTERVNGFDAKLLG